jgi:hypothetical protein
VHQHIERREQGRTISELPAETEPFAATKMHVEAGTSEAIKNQKLRSKQARKHVERLGNAESGFWFDPGK